MPKVNLRDARRIKTAAGEVRALKLPGGQVWRRRVIGDLYGVAPGKIALHLSPRDAVVSGGNVVSIANRGGAGPAFDATAGGTPVPLSDDGRLMQIGAATSYLDLASPADLMGVRLFIVAQRFDLSERRLASFELGTAGDGNVNSDQMVLIYAYTAGMPDGGAASRLVLSQGGFGGPTNGPFPLTTELALYEIQLVAGVMTICVNGVQYASGNAFTSVPAQYLISRLFAGQISHANNWRGPVGDTLGLITDGSHASEIETIRRELAELFGITLGPSRRRRDDGGSTMMDLIREMFAAPEAQASAYDWAAVLLAHAMIGAVLAALLGLALGAGRAAVIVAVGYAAIWEGGQIALAGAGLADSLVDASAVAFGAALVAGAWGHKRGVLGAAVAGLAMVLWRGVGRRK